MHQITKLKCYSSRLAVDFAHPFKSGLKTKMKMQLEQRRQTMLQLHVSDQHKVRIILEVWRYVQIVALLHFLMLVTASTMLAPPPPPPRPLQ